MDGLDRFREGDVLRDALFQQYAPVRPSVGKPAPTAPLLISAAGTPVVDLVASVVAALGPQRTVWRVESGAGRVRWEFTWFAAMPGGDVALAGICSALESTGVAAPLPSEWGTASALAVVLDVDDGSVRCADVMLLAGLSSGAASAVVRYRRGEGGLAVTEVLLPHVVDVTGPITVDRIRSSIHFDRSRFDVDAVLWPELRGAVAAAVGLGPSHDELYAIGLELPAFLAFMDRAGFDEVVAGRLGELRGELDHLRFDVSLGYRCSGEALEVVGSSIMGVI